NAAVAPSLSLRPATKPTARSSMPAIPGADKMARFSWPGNSEGSSELLVPKGTTHRSACVRSSLAAVRAPEVRRGANWTATSTTQKGMPTGATIPLKWNRSRQASLTVGKDPPPIVGLAPLAAPVIARILQAQSMLAQIIGILEQPGRRDQRLRAPPNGARPIGGRKDAVAGARSGRGCRPRSWPRARPKRATPLGTTRRDPTLSATVILPISRSNAIVAGHSDRDACPMLFRAIHRPLPATDRQSEAQRSPFTLDTAVEA